MYEDQTESKIRQRMLDNVPSDLNKREGSFIYDGISPAAIELALVYIELDRIINLGFVQTTYGQYLDYRAAEHGLTRKTATKATGQVTISGSDGTTVPAGTVFATGSGVEFETISQVVIDVSGQAVADIEAVLAGDEGNVPADSITEIPVSIQGVTGVINTNPTTGGADEESDADLVARLLEKVRTPATSGNVGHYLQWAKEVSGVGDAKVFPLWNGVGTVKVVIINTDKQPADSSIVQNVQDYIDPNENGDGYGEAPIGAIATVESALGLDINVSATVVLDTGAVLSEVQSAFEEALAEYLADIAFQQNYVSYAQIGSLLLNTSGVMDYSDLLINGASANVAVGDTADNCQVAVKGTVTLIE